MTVNVIIYLLNRKVYIYVLKYFARRYKLVIFSYVRSFAAPAVSVILIARRKNIFLSARIPHTVSEYLSAERVILILFNYPCVFLAAPVP